MWAHCSAATFLYLFPVAPTRTYESINEIYTITGRIASIANYVDRLIENRASAAQKAIGLVASIEQLDAVEKIS